MNKKYYKPSYDEIRKKLDDLQYKVTQESATERPHHNEFNKCFEEGLYVDVVSGEPLFTSKDKFESGCGWPAFSKPVDNEFIKEKLDLTHNMHRVEVRSTYGDSHLGHVFDDGPKELGGTRYCINSAALRFIPKDKFKEEGYEEYLRIFNEK